MKSRSVLCLATVLLVALTWNSLAFGDEIHEAAKKGDLEKIKGLIKGNPGLIFSKDNSGGPAAPAWRPRVNRIETKQADKVGLT